MDIGMPKVDGIAATARLRRDRIPAKSWYSPPSTPMIMRHALDAPAATIAPLGWKDRPCNTRPLACTRSRPLHYAGLCCAMARSSATQHLTLEYTKCCGSPADLPA
jgi:hypothetical protein